tara:strand:- start:1058 stop:1720 length:663 start_codon:yes stop_codon:yes gene_type:complete
MARSPRNSRARSKSKSKKSRKYSNKKYNPSFYIILGVLMIGIILFNSLMKTADIEGFKRRRNRNRRRKEGFIDNINLDNIDLDKINDNFNLDKLQDKLGDTFGLKKLIGGNKKDTNVPDLPVDTNIPKNSNLENNNKKLVLVYADWCGHCKKMKPDWDRLEKEFPDKCVSYNSDSPEGKDMFKKHNLSGYPAMFYIDGNGNKLDDYNGDRKYSALKAALN